MFSRAYIPMVPPASLRLLAVRLRQTGRFALPSVVVVSSAPGDNAILLLPLQQMCSLRQCHFR